MHQGKIIIADDDAVMRLDLRIMLECMGHTIVGEADNGESVCQLGRRLRPDLFILDVMMPRMNGLQVAEIISQERLGPVLMLTGYSDVALIEQATQAGVLAYLVKPFRHQEMQPAIEIAIARYRELRALEGARDIAQEQIETNRLVGRAKRLLMDRHDISDQEAFRRLNAQALSMERPLREIAECILLASGVCDDPPTRRPR